MDERIAELGAIQHGVVSFAQLRKLGVSRRQVHRRVELGRLHRLHRGVYAVGHTAPSLPREGMAAVLACRRRADEADEPGHASPAGEGSAAGSVTAGTRTVLDHWGAALSHRSAAEHWGLLTPRGGAIAVSVPGYGGKKRQRGVRLQRSLTLLPAHVTLLGGIPVTTPARTIADLRRVVSTEARPGLVSPKELRRAIRQANVLGLPVDDEATRERTRSDLERDFFRICRRYGLPLPAVNVSVGRHLVDFLWSDQRLAVETDGYRYHRGRAAFQEDRGRDLRLRGLGYEVIRLSESADRIGAGLRSRGARRQVDPGVGRVAP